MRESNCCAVSSIAVGATALAKWTIFPIERCLLTVHLPPWAPCPAAGEDARPTFTAGGTAEVGPALAGAGTIP